MDGAALAPPERTADYRRPSWRLGARSRERDLQREGQPATETAESVAALGSISESRILQSAGHAPANIRQAAYHRVCRGLSAAHRVAPWLHRGRAASSVGFEYNGCRP